MSSIVLVSDTHGNLHNLYKLDELIMHSSYFIHLGNNKSDAHLYRSAICVGGNGDGVPTNDRVIEIDGIKIFITHGHKYDVKNSLLPLALKAEECGAKYVFYGHTHIADICEVNGVTLINPGSLYSSPMGYLSYCYLHTHNGRLLSKIVKIV